MRLWEFAVRRWQFTLLLFGLLLGVGFTTLRNIPRAEDPEFHAPDNPSFVDDTPILDEFLAAAAQHKAAAYTI